MGELLGQGRYDAQKPVCHGRMGYKVAASNVHDPSPTCAPRLRDACTALAREAAREIMRIYAGDLGERDQGRQEPGHRCRPCRRGDHRRRPAQAHARPAGGRRGGDGGGPCADARRRAVLAGRSARRHQGIHQEERRVHGEHRPDRGRPADARHRAGAGAPTRCGAATPGWAPTRARTAAPSRRSPTRHAAGRRA